MSGSTQQKVFEIKNFKGINLYNGGTAIAPDEFTILKNVRTDDGVIKADRVDALISMPVPKVLSNTDTYNDIATPWAATSAYAASTEIAFPIGSAVNGDCFSVLAPFAISGGVPTGNVWLSATIYSSLVTGTSGINNISIPGASLGYVVTGTSTSGISGSLYVPQEIMVNGLTGASADGLYIAIRGSGGTGVNQNTAVGAYLTTATAGKSWDAINYPWSCVVLRHTLTGGHVLNICPINIFSETKINSAYEAYATGNVNGIHMFAGSGVAENQPFSRLTIPSGLLASTDTYSSFFHSVASGAASGYGAYNINDVVRVTATGTGVGGVPNAFFNVSKYPDFNIIEVSATNVNPVERQTYGVISLTHPNQKNGIVLDYDANITNGGNILARSKRKNSYCYFNGYLVASRQGAPVAYQLNTSFLTSPYAIKIQPLVTPTFNCPLGVLSYNNFLMFYNVRNAADEVCLPHRMYFSTAGAVDGFSSSQYENLSDGKPVLWIEEWFGSLIIFFADHIKRYTGTPGNAVLETIFYVGVPCGEMVCKTPKGIFFLSSEGLYLYNGSFQRVEDKSTYFDNANFTNALEDGWMAYDYIYEDLLFYPGNASQVNVFNTRKMLFRQLDYSVSGQDYPSAANGIRIFNYYDNLNMKTAISFPGIAHVKELYGSKAVSPQSGIKYKLPTIQSGFIDVDPVYEQKRFDCCVLDVEDDGSNGSNSIVVTFYFDDNTSIISSSTSITDYPNTKSVLSLKFRIDKQARLIKYKIVGNSGTLAQDSGQLIIYKIKFIYDPITIK